MTATLAILISVLVVWMLALGWCGYGKRFLLALPVLLAGLGLNWMWMVWGLRAKPFENPVIMAQISAVMYAFCALVTGWMIGRFVRQWRLSKIERESEV
jgi:hypothetical protein